MTKIYVAEFQGLAETGQSDSVPILTVPPSLEQTVAIGTQSAASLAFQSTTAFVEISADSICSIAFGPVASVAATANNCRLNANERIIRRVPVGVNEAVAVIVNT